MVRRGGKTSVVSRSDLTPLKSPQSQNVTSINRSENPRRGGGSGKTIPRGKTTSAALIRENSPGFFFLFSNFFLIIMLDYF